MSNQPRQRLFLIASQNRYIFLLLSSPQTSNHKPNADSPQIKSIDSSPKQIPNHKQSLLPIASFPQFPIQKQSFHIYFYFYFFPSCIIMTIFALSLQILFNQRNMFASENHEQNGQSSPRNVSASDLALFEELESVGPAPQEGKQNNQQQHPWTHSFLRSEGSPRLIPLNELHDAHSYQAEPSLFSKLSADMSQDSLSLHSSSQKQSRHRFQNDTKNIPKNFGKGILNFIQKNEAITRDAAKRSGVSYVDLLRYVRGKKGSISTIAELRELWTEPKMGRCMRVLSNLFLRKYALGYIFNSRIVSFGSHVKYRSALWEALHRPEDFNHIKKY